jgi:hypothetical protein
MVNPPEDVKLAMGLVYTTLGHTISGLRTVQGTICKDDFTPRIVNFDTTSQRARPLCDLIRKDFLRRPSYSFEVVNRSRKARGPLIKCLLAQVLFSFT